ncbi:hypothetical protein [Streptomyces sp. bgisy034]|uniref:hypothetical protein n=1 Tax=Streptomyces sp. bgisy034 TaxID=3413774 RepID=UPI003EBA6B55
MHSRIPRTLLAGLAIRIDLGAYVILNLALGGIYPVGWNKVTTPYRGLPQSNVDRLAAGGVQAEVDWVRVGRKG